MSNYSGSYKPTKTTEFLINLNKLLFIFGLPNFWVEDLDFSKKFTIIIQKLSKFGNMALLVMVIAECSAFITQKNLTERQFSDSILFIMGQIITIGYRLRMTHQERQIRDIMYKLGIGLKEIYNDSEVEKQMIKRSKLFSAGLTLNCAMCLILYTIEAIFRVIRTGVTFNTIITAWPDLDDRSTLANIGRSIFYIIWWIYVSRIFAVYSLVIYLIIAVSHQFKNLNSYFCSLEGIFEEDSLTQEEKEQEYEKALKVGFKMHSETLNCISEIQTICRDVFSGQIIFNNIMLILLMYQMVNFERNLTNVLTLVVTAMSILFSTGFFMWNSGDITVEAELLPTAMYSSGWENCSRQSSVRVRKLLVIAMSQAQRPVVLTGFGIIALSYQSYVSIVKSSYSVFSVLY